MEQAAGGMKVRAQAALLGQWLVSRLGLLLVALLMLPVAPVWLAWIAYRRLRCRRPAPAVGQ